MAGYSRAELVGAPHSIIRHPDMPRAVFKLLWDQIGAEQEIFAYVKNMAKSGDFYWVFAHVTPSYDEAGKVVGYHSNRRVPERRIIDGVITPLYADLLKIEQSFANAKDGLAASYGRLVEIVKSKALAMTNSSSRFEAVAVQVVALAAIVAAGAYARFGQAESPTNHP